MLYVDQSTHVVEMVLPAINDHVVDIVLPSLSAQVVEIDVVPGLFHGPHQMLGQGQIKP
jgi:Holliday junction resolvasome RuvABC ATP-dependent DNA helicase subunit